MDFRPLEITDKEIFEKYAKMNLNCDDSFAMIWLENFNKTTEICVLDNIIILRTRRGEKIIYYPPLTEDTKLIQEAIDLILKHEAQYERPFVICGLVAEQIALLPSDTYNIVHDLDAQDYIYSVSDLTNLAGGKYHSKRNFITRFEKSYNYSFRPYKEEDRETLIELFKKWEVDAVGNYWEEEKPMFNQALDYWRELDLKIGLLFVDKTLVAFSINHVTKDMALTLVEKADTSYIGAYQMINRETASAFFQTVKFINRQDDMGIEGLRKSKLSYHPIQLTEKYNILGHK